MRRQTALDAKYAAVCLNGVDAFSMDSYLRPVPETELEFLNNDSPAGAPVKQARPPQAVRDLSVKSSAGAGNKRSHLLQERGGQAAQADLQVMPLKCATGTKPISLKCTKVQLSTLELTCCVEQERLGGRCREACLAGSHLLSHQQVAGILVDDSSLVPGVHPAADRCRSSSSSSGPGRLHPQIPNRAGFPGPQKTDPPGRKEKGTPSLEEQIDVPLLLHSGLNHSHKPRLHASCRLKYIACAVVR